jgi:acetylornithine/N-succinyldiaminopimelate aminotransferase
MPPLLPTYHQWPLTIVRGLGSWVWDEAGRRYLDFYGGHCVTVLGHCPGPVVTALKEQAGTLLFYSNVVDSPPRQEAADRLTRLAPMGLGWPYFCNSGTEANETALKLARTHTGKSGIVAMHGGFHGRTVGSLAVTAGIGYREPYREILPECHFVPFGDVDAVTAVFDEHGDIGGVIVEPIQSLGGMNVAPDSYFQILRALCDAHGACLIFDEVQTGVGRTGTFSIADQLGVRPDMITLAKSLGSGVPVGAVLVTEEIARRVRPGDHGSTFGGGMLAMRAVSATLEMLSEGGWMDRAAVVYAALREGLEGLGGEVRGRGCLIGVDFGRKAGPVVERLREEGVLAGTSSDPSVLRLMPALTTSAEEIDHFLEVLERVLQGIDEPATA